MVNIIPVENIEVTSNKVTEITELATNEQYPSAKAVYDALQSVKVDTGEKVSAYTLTPEDKAEIVAAVVAEINSQTEA